MEIECLAVTRHLAVRMPDGDASASASSALSAGLNIPHFPLPRLPQFAGPSPSLDTALWTWLKATQAVHGPQCEDLFSAACDLQDRHDNRPLRFQGQICLNEALAL